MAEASTSVRTLVRTINRELRRGTVNPRSSAVRRTEPLPRYLRALLRKSDGAASSANTNKRLDNIEHFITHTRVHEELLARYNPVYGKSEAERIKATANRVGWDVPVEYQDSLKKEMEEKDGGIDKKYRT